MMKTRLIKTFYNKVENSLTVVWIITTDKVSVDFSLRCPTPTWNYYLALNLGYHHDEQQYEGQTKMETCFYRPNGCCYCDGTSLGAEELLEKYQASGNEETIWKALEELLTDRFNIAN